MLGARAGSAPLHAEGRSGEWRVEGGEDTHQVQGSLRSQGAVAPGEFCLGFPSGGRRECFGGGDI